jgi:NAD(P)-dependent dehydrogenase (short-subunit alcohol dehydrogenase family)
MNAETQKSKIAIATGGSCAIGKCIALNAAKRDIGVILTFNSHPGEGEADGLFSALLPAQSFVLLTIFRRGDTHIAGEYSRKIILIIKTKLISDLFY